ncbi:MAG: DNA polymerase III subunit beta [Solirubrobacteraceae bacterium]
MKVSVARDSLLAQLQSVARVASTHSAVQALSGVQITADGDAAELRATDLEVGLRVPLEAAIERPGEVVLPARLTLEVVRALAAERVTLELRPTEHDVAITSGAASFHIRTLRAEDFPPLPEPSRDAVVAVPAAAFVSTVQTVARAASRDETRPVLTGILVSATAQELRMVATDSYRLSVKRTELESPLEGSFEANVPARALQELARLAQQAGSDRLTVGVGANQVVFEVDGATLSSRLIEGQFPNHAQLVPESFEHELRLPNDELTEVVRRISLLAQKNAPLRLAFSDGQLTISAQTPDVGEARETIPAPFKGDPLEIGFNPDFLRDGLESVGSQDVLLKLISPLRPGLIESGDAGGFLYLIMPIRLNV